MHLLLKSRLQAVVRRQRQMTTWLTMAGMWVLVGVLVFLLNPLLESHAALTVIMVVVLGLAGLLAVLVKTGKAEPDWRHTAAFVEARYPELEGRLLTAVQQQPDDENHFGYLQQRLFEQSLLHAEEHDWPAACVPLPRLRLAQSAHLLALLFLVISLAGLQRSHWVRSSDSVKDSGVTITPGDTSVERGSAVVVLAKFDKILPAHVDLVIADSTTSKRIPLVKSLGDPMFGSSIPDVTTNLVYHVEYGGQRTHDYKVSVFEYPRLESADADIQFPAYTGQTNKHIPNTRRVTAVAGSRLDLVFHFNKSVAKARLVPSHQDAPGLALSIDESFPRAFLKQFPLEASESYDLQLVDSEGRTNKVPARFVFESISNRPPEIHLVAPRGDQRPSALEEIAFEGTVWDDFGVRAYGIGYSIVGQEPKWIQLGESVAGGEKHSFKYLLPLEQLGVEADQLISWFVWADDYGSEGELRRTTGDLFFGEVRPFEEVFREAQGMDGGGQQGGGGGEQGGQTGRLVDLQKQIISATWKLQRESPKTSRKHAPQSAEPKSNNGQTSVPSFEPPFKRGEWHNRSRVPLVQQPQHMYAMFAGQLERPSSGRTTGISPALTQGSTQTGAKSDALHTYSDDATVVRDAQAQALEQAQEALENQRDSRAAGLWRTAVNEMQRALTRLQAAANSPAELKEALASEQAAYQSLLRLQEHEYQVARSRNRSQQGGGRSQQMQRQLDQMDLTQSENRYETQKEAQKQEPSQRREQLQVMNRLQELARRQQDLNERLKELQTALQEARTEAERAEIQRRLKRLQEEEQQMLADLDETRQRMDRPENQSSMADERRQLEQTRQEIQRAAEAASQGAASQALAAGTRAQEQLQQAHDQMRKESSSQFSEDLRQMRSQARELAREQERIQQQMEQRSGTEHKSLSAPPGSEQVGEQLTHQKDRLTNLLARATDVSQQAEQAEPLLSKELYDTVRKFGQDSANDVKQLQEDLINRGLMTRSLYDRLKDSPEPDGAKLLDLASDLLNRRLLPQADQSQQRARAGIENLKQGVERAAESVLGDDTEALRLAQQNLNELTEQLRREAAAAASGQTNAAGAQNQTTSGAQAGGTNDLVSANLRDAANQQGRRSRTGTNDIAEAQRASSERAASGERQSQRGTQQGDSRAGGERPGRIAQNDGGPNQRGDRNAAGGNWANGGDTGAWENSGNYLDRLLNDARLRDYGPLTGGDFVQWADRLRDVEDMMDDPVWRNQIAQARERARLLRQDFKRDRKKPDWAVVQLQVMAPLLEVRDRIADELARRESREALVPIDRDPVPDKYSELVRRYYEQLGNRSNAER